MCKQECLSVSQLVLLVALVEQLVHAACDLDVVLLAEVGQRDAKSNSPIVKRPLSHATI